MNKLILSALVLCGGLWAVPPAAAGQATGNPFDLTPRLTAAGRLPADSIADTPAVSGNPFDIVAAPRPAAAREAAVAPPRARRPASPEEDALSYKRIKLVVILTILVLLAFLVTVLRSLVNKSVLAFSNETMMNQLYRSQQGRGTFPFLLPYAFFLFNAGVFVFFLLRHLNLPTGLGPLPLLLYCVLGVAGLFLLKHLVLGLLGFVFPIAEEVNRYIFTIVIFGIVIGLILVPANILLAYASPALLPYVIYFALGAVGLIYLFRYLRSLLIANKFLLFHKFHFLLYICTVEIAPALFLLKLLLRQL